MGTITSGANGRSDVGWVNRSAATIKDDAKFSKVKTAGPTNTQTDFTGSLAGSSGFIIETAGQGVITPTLGDAITASALTAKTLYEIGVRRISGSCTVHVVY
tara:strand:+ start:317 stop:622 length:306 start_codon:yes stop_codon:yes gene_type:complete